MTQTPRRSPQRDSIHRLPVLPTLKPQQANYDALDSKARKRENDRLAQRAIRQRTKARIAYLESLVHELRASCASDPEISRSLHEDRHIRPGRKRSLLSLNSVMTISLTLTQ
jgi:hypothetical protein